MAKDFDARLWRMAAIASFAMACFSTFFWAKSMEGWHDALGAETAQPTRVLTNDGQYVPGQFGDLTGLAIHVLVSGADGTIYVVLDQNPEYSATFPNACPVQRDFRSL